MGFIDPKRFGHFVDTNRFGHFVDLGQGQGNDVQSPVRPAASPVHESGRVAGETPESGVAFFGLVRQTFARVLGARNSKEQ